MKLKKLIIPLLLTAMLLSGCVSGEIPERETLPRQEGADVLIAQEGTSHLTEVKNDEIDRFIEEYNSQQTDETLRIADGYSVFYDRGKDAYYICSDKANITIKLSEKGTVVSAALTNTDDITKQLSASNIIINVLWNNSGYIPEEQQQKIQSIHEEAARLQKTIEEKSSLFENNKIELNTDLPETTMPTK